MYNQTSAWRILICDSISENYVKTEKLRKCLHKPLLTRNGFREKEPLFFRDGLMYQTFATRSV